MAKYLLIAAIVISLATAGLGFVNHGKLADALASLDQTKASLNSTSTKLTASQAAEKKTAADLAAADADKVKLGSDLSAAQAAATKAAGDLEASTKTVAERDATIADLNVQLTAARGGTPPPNPGQEDPRIAQLTQDKTELAAALDSSKSQLSAAQAKLADFETQAKNRQQGLMKKGLEGRILAVNPAWNFVVLSIGDKQGASNNAELLIKRSGQYLGKVRITSVEPSTSIADIVANTLPDGVSVQPGDSVIFQGQEE